MQRIKKHFDAGYNCACGPVEMIQPGDPEELESLPRGVTPRGMGSLSASAKGGSDPRIPSFPEEVEDSTVIRVSGIGGDSCICRTATTILYIHSYDGRVVREYVNGAAQRDFLYAGSNRIGVSEKTGSTYKLRYFLTDHLGSTRQTIDSSGLMESRLDYYPYGNTRPGALISYNTRIRYTGKVLDDEDINQTYYGARYLNGVTNRFNSVDPLQGKYSRWSPYCYGLANPIRNVDVDGRRVVYDISKFLAVREKYLGWLPIWAQELIMPSDPMIGAAAIEMEGVNLAGAAARAGIEAAENARGPIQQFFQGLVNKAEKLIGQNAKNPGSTKHAIMAREIEAKARSEGIEMSAEVPYFEGKPIKCAGTGSVKLDVVEGPVDRPTRIIDWKTGKNPRDKLPPSREKKIRDNLPEGYQDIPIDVVKPDEPT